MNPSTAMIEYTDHATVLFTDGAEVEIAEWHIVHHAPGPDGTVRLQLVAWYADHDRDGGKHPSGPARLERAELRGYGILTGLDVTCETLALGDAWRLNDKPWDHGGFRYTLEWTADRTVPRPAREARPARRSPITA